MREKIILVILLFISYPSFGKKIYTITKEEFANQFNEKHHLLKVSCKNHKGQTVWLYCNKNTTLTLSLKNSKKEELMLHTIKFKQGIIEAVKYNVWVSGKKVSRFDFNEVTAISIQPKFQEYEMPYFNIDSSLIIAKQKNDSLRRTYNYGSEFIIAFKNAKYNKDDTLRIIENACYNLTFNGGNKTRFGVVQKITRDSIYISNFFNYQMAKENSKTFELLGYPVTDIREIALLKAGGFSYKIINLDDYVLSVENRQRSVNNIPYWFAINPTTGEVGFYRLWQTDRGYSGITEKDGKAIWYEGEKTE